MSPARSILILVAVIGGLAIAVATRLSFGTDITNLMPEGGAGSLADVSRRLTDSELARTMVLNVGAPDTATAVAGASALAELLAENPEVAWLRAGVDEEQLQAIYELYFPRRHYFVAFDPGRIPELTSETALRAQAERAKRDLALPTASLGKRLVTDDPLGSFRALLERISVQQPSLELVDGQFVTRDGRFAVLFLGTRAPAFDGDRQKALLEDLSAAFDAGRPALRRSARARAERRQRVRRRDRAQHPQRRQLRDRHLDRLGVRVAAALPRLLAEPAAHELPDAGRAGVGDRPRPAGVRPARRPDARASAPR